MTYKRLAVVFAAMILVAPTATFAASTSAPIKAASLAEGVDRSKASKALVWEGSVIGINAGSHDVIITESTALNRIKAFAQRNIKVGARTEIVMKDGDDKKFDDLDIGYRVQVHGSYDPKTRTIFASLVEIIKVPDAPITKTK